MYNWKCYKIILSIIDRIFLVKFQINPNINLSQGNVNKESTIFYVNIDKIEFESDISLNI